MFSFICPVCSGKLSVKGKSFVCKNNHLFDISSYGYVNLLPSNKKHSSSPGDDKLMVTARNNFLSKGYYSHLKNALENLSIKYCELIDNVNVLDCGCGEGYYTQGIWQALENAGKKPCVKGIDISKDAVLLAAKRVKKAQFAVASSFRLPIESKSADILINCFSPLCIKEFNRVLKKNGIFMYVVPDIKHLWQLKEILYENPYENILKDEEYDGFKLVDMVKVQKEVIIDSSEDIKNLFSMTPYVYRTPKENQEKLLNCTHVQMNAHFVIYVYKKIKNI